MDKVEIKADTITTRRKAAQVVEEATDSGASVIDLSEVEFISRSAADEFLAVATDDIEIVGAKDDVKRMLDAVKQTAKAPA